jgi:hypothetical protein
MLALACGWQHTLLHKHYELTTPQRSASPPRWEGSRRSSWRWSSDYALVPDSRDCVQVLFSTVRTCALKDER